MHANNETKRPSFQVSGIHGAEIQNWDPMGLVAPPKIDPAQTENKEQTIKILSLETTVTELKNEIQQLANKLA